MVTPAPPDGRPDVSSDVRAAGAVVLGSGRRVLLVHRPKYDDWAFPKGKLDEGETSPAAAVREVAEETGLRVRLGVPLTSQRYPFGPGHKSVDYWVARPSGSDDVSGYVPNDEIDRVEWLRHDEAADRLTYDVDRTTLAEALERRRRTQPLVVLRHADARARRTWTADDRLRPLSDLGREQADRLRPVLAAYGVTRVVTSTSTRCVETVRAYAEGAGVRLRQDAGLSEEEATEPGVRKRVARLVERLAESDRAGVLCTHRPVLPLVFDELGVEDPGLAKGELFVVHLRKGEPVGCERHHG